MADKKLRAILEFLVQGDKRAQQALNQLSDSGEKVEKGMGKASAGTKLMDIALGNFVAGNLLKAQGALVNFGLSSIQAASDVEQMQGKFNTVFGEQAGQVEAQIEKMTKAVKRSKFEWMGYAATLQDTFVPLGFARGEAAKMSVQVTALAEDLAAFNNLRTEDVVRDLQSALVGNTETLRKYGVVAQETQIKQKALELGLWDGTGAIDAQSKAATILQITMEGTADAQGAALRESDSFESSMRALEAATLDLKVAVGTELLPVANDLLQWLIEVTNRLGPAVAALGGDLPDAVHKLATANADAIGTELSLTEAIEKSFKAYEASHSIIGLLSGAQAASKDSIAEVVKAVASESDNLDDLIGTLSDAVEESGKLSTSGDRVYLTIDDLGTVIIGTTEELQGYIDAAKEAVKQQSLLEASGADLILTQHQLDRQYGDVVRMAEHNAREHHTLTGALNETDEATGKLTTDQKKYEENLRRGLGTYDRVRYSSLQTRDAYEAEQAALEELSETSEDYTKLQEELYQRQAELAKVWVDAANGGLDYFKTSLDDLGPKMVFTGGLTADQNRILEEATSNYNKVTQEIEDHVVGLKGYGLTADEVAEHLGDLADEQAYWQGIISQYSGIQSSANMVIQESQVDVDKLNTALYEQIQSSIQSADVLQGLGISAEDAGLKMVDMGIATGQLNQQQAEQIINGIRLKQAVEDIGKAYLEEQISAESAAQILQDVAAGYFDTAQEALNAKRESEALEKGLSKIGEGNYIAHVAAEVDDTSSKKVSTLSSDLDNIAAFWEAEVEARTDDAQSDAETLHTELNQISTAEGLNKWAAKFDTSDAVRAKDEEVIPLSDEAKQFRDDAPHEALFKANTTAANYRIDELYDNAKNTAGNYYLDYYIRVHGEPPGKQHGGSVMGGMPYVVGEAGPELFVPSVNGRIVPNASTPSGGQSLSIGELHLHLGQAKGTPQQVARAVANELGSMMKG